MTKSKRAATISPLTFARAGVTPGFDKLRVVDDKSGEVVTDVIEVDVPAGRVVRRDLDENGHLQIVDGAIKLLTEERKVRLEEVEPDDADEDGVRAGDEVAAG